MTVKNVTSPSVIVQNAYSEDSKALRVIEHGITFGNNKQDGTVGIHSDISTAVFIGEDRHVHITNTSNATVFVTFGAAAVGAPDEDSGIPVLANSTIRLCSGSNEYIRSSAKVHCIEIAD